jgi:hypothetical protein
MGEISKCCKCNCFKLSILHVLPTLVVEEAYARRKVQGVQAALADSHSEQCLKPLKLRTIVDLAWDSDICSWAFEYKFRQ